MGPWCKQKAYTFCRPLQLAQYHPLPICHECLVVPTFPILLVTCMIYSISVSLCLAEEINYSILFYSNITNARLRNCSCDCRPTLVKELRNCDCLSTSFKWRNCGPTKKSRMPNSAFYIFGANQLLYQMRQII
jgi:hypothetical protein